MHKWRENAILIRIKIKHSSPFTWESAILFFLSWVVKNCIYYANALHFHNEFAKDYYHKLVYFIRINNKPPPDDDVKLLAEYPSRGEHTDEDERTTSQPASREKERITASYYK